MKAFEITDEDMVAIRIAAETIRLFLGNEGLNARQIIGLGNALFALERLPEFTEGVVCEFGVVYRFQGESKYIEFEVTDAAFGISIGGTAYDPNVGSDTYSEPGWRIELGGFRGSNDATMLYDLSDRLSEFVNLGAEIVVRDESCIGLE